MSSILMLLLLFNFSQALNDPNQFATICNTNVCKLPDCNCASTNIPGAVWLDETPQMVVLTMQAAVNSRDYDLIFDQVLAGRTNPNGCPLTGTWFVAHDYTQYDLANKLYYEKHFELGVQSIRHEPDIFWKSALYGDWLTTIDSTRTALEYLGKIPITEIKGMRAPELRMGGNHMFQMLYDYSKLRVGGWVYDSSWPSAIYRDPALWPFSLDHFSVEDCQIGHCPTASFPGIWEFPTTDYNDTAGNICNTLSMCQSFQQLHTEDDWVEFLVGNFNRHFNGNKAPFPLYIESQWLNNGVFDTANVLNRFLDQVLTQDSVFVLSVRQAIEWVKQPTFLSDVQSFPPWTCPPTVGNNHCPTVYTCKYDVTTKDGLAKELRQFTSCVKCPPEYPDYNNPYGIKVFREP